MHINEYKEYAKYVVKIHINISQLTWTHLQADGHLTIISNDIKNIKITTA